MKTTEKSYSEMDANELLSHVDGIFEWIEQHGEGPMLLRALKNLQSEIRRRIMERDAAVVIEPEPREIEVEVKPVKFAAVSEGTGPRLTLALYKIVLRRTGEGAYETVGLNRSEVEMFLRGVRVVSEFGLRLGKVPPVPS